MSDIADIIRAVAAIAAQYGAGVIIGGVGLAIAWHLSQLLKSSREELTRERAEHLAFVKDSNKQQADMIDKNTATLIDNARANERVATAILMVARAP